MNTRTLFVYLAALMLATISMQANAAVRKADCRYWQMDEWTPPKSTLDGPWGNPTGFSLILATK